MRYRIKDRELQVLSNSTCSRADFSQSGLVLRPDIISRR